MVKNNINRLSNPPFFSALGKDRTTKIRRKLQKCKFVHKSYRCLENKAKKALNAILSELTEENNDLKNNVLYVTESGLP